MSRGPRGKWIATVLMVLASGVGATFVVVSLGGFRPLVGPRDRVFPPATHVLAQFEFNGDVHDVSGNRRKPRSEDATFVATEWGSGLRISSRSPKLLDWSAYASLLRPPFTIEIVVTPKQTANYAKLLSFVDSTDRGLYYRGEGIAVYSAARIGEGKLKAGDRHYLAFVFTGSREVKVYAQGELLGKATSPFALPPRQAIFFRDDTSTSRMEQLDGVVEALRISSVERTAAEIEEVHRRLER